MSNDVSGSKTWLCDLCGAQNPRDPDGRGSLNCPKCGGTNRLLVREIAESFRERDRKRGPNRIKSKRALRKRGRK